MSSKRIKHKGLAKKLVKPDRSGKLIKYDNFVDGVNFTRDTEASAFAGSSTIKWYGPNELRKEDRGDGNGSVPLFEGSGENLALHSEDFDNAVWEFKSGQASATGSLTTFIDGESDGNLVEFSASSNADVFQDINFSLVSENVKHICSAFVKLSGASPNLDHVRIMIRDLSGSAQIDTDTEFSASWIRLDYTDDTNTGTSGNGGRIRIRNSSLAQSGSFFAGGFQYENDQSFPTSYIRTTTTTGSRAADNLTIPDANVPSEMLDGRWQFDFYPYFDNTENTTFNDLFSLSTGDFVDILAADDIRWRGKGGDSDIFEIIRSDSFTYSRHQKITVQLDGVAGYLKVSGATSGDSFKKGKAGLFRGRNTFGNLRIGARSDGARPFFGRISEPRRWELPFNFEEIPNRAAHFRGDKVKLNGGVVEEWHSLVNNITASQNTAASRPGHSSSNPNFNNRATVNFDGSDDFLSASHTPLLTASENGLTIFAVGTFYSGSTLGIIYEKEDPGQTPEYGLRRQGDNDPIIVMRDDSGGNYVVIDETNDFDPTPSASVIVSRFSGTVGATEAAIRVDGNSEVTDSNNTGFFASTGSLMIGNKNGGVTNMHMDLAELIIFNRHLTDEEFNVAYYYVNSANNIRK